MLNGIIVKKWLSTIFFLYNQLIEAEYLSCIYAQKKYIFSKLKRKSDQINCIRFDCFYLFGSHNILDDNDNHGFRKKDGYQKKQYN